MSYVAFAADIFGKGVRPVADKDAQVGDPVKYRRDRALARSRAQASLAWLRQHPLVVPAGSGSWSCTSAAWWRSKLARMGAPLAGTAVFHGSLDTPTPNDARNIKGRGAGDARRR